MNLDTPEGMADAVAWTEMLVSYISEGGTWAVPRSSTLVTVMKSKKQVVISGDEPSIARVFKAMGWEVI